MVRRVLLSLCFLLCIALKSLAQADAIERTWFNDGKSAKIQVYKAKDGKYYGKIVWLKEPMRNGKPKLDEKNPDPKKKEQPIIGLIILKGFVKDGGSKYEDGTIYDPKNGKTYSCKITLNDKILDVRGYVGISLIGRTTKWTMAE